MTNRNIRQVKVVKSPPFLSMAKIASDWRKSIGGVLPTTVEDTIRNINAYCSAVAKLN
jgi:hypothetical protein